MHNMAACEANKSLHNLDALSLMSTIAIIKTNNNGRKIKTG